jgi:hypothetical protein
MEPRDFRMQMLDLRAYNLTVSKVCNLQSPICNH